jgi:diadenosine tetraphosphate (Ap4A) HIT family hydrolase
MNVPWSGKYYPGMPLTPDQFYVNALDAADTEGRLPLSRLTAWEIFPFESEGLRVVPLARPEVPEPSRRGEDGAPCDSCAGEGCGDIWQDDHWRLVTFSEPSGAPLVLMLLPKSHFDLTDLPDELAREFGRLIVHVARAIESLPNVARAHVSRWGDGGAHLHVFFFARPEGFVQLRGTCFAVWDDLLPPTPRDIRDADALTVASTLSATYGGHGA